MKKWLKKLLKRYWLDALISLFFSLIGGMLVVIFCFHIPNYFGSLADWISGIGSFGTIIFAYRQINLQQKELNEQQKEYKKDKEEAKKKEELSCRPFFDIVTCFSISSGKEVFFDPKDGDINSSIRYFFKETTNTGQVVVKNDKYIYCIRNVGSATAVNVFFTIGYNTKSENAEANNSDIISLPAISPGESCLIATHGMISEPSCKILSYDIRGKREIGDAATLNVEVKIDWIDIYFDSLLNYHYDQYWWTKETIGQYKIIDFKKSEISPIHEKDLLDGKDSLSEIIY
ncbi:hypothetical protein [Lactobacillus bombicola]|uniref:hypothetical protein n=1 Tax=Lactobacillus bombicola TaxID=1505723 RepID=UPI000E57C11D|nr:hypothetical protein [Lactobacillus bombicola]RHW48679.1 hypothetical protein DS833_07480 [Lactobacillus bombicola]